MMPYTSKLPHVGTTIFTEINQVAQKYKAINLAQGFPGFEPHPQLTKEVEQALRNGKNQYAPMSGIFSLRETLCEKMFNLYDKSYHPETEITITAGATQAIYTIISAFIHPEDEVIVFKPAYDCYEPAIEVNGGKPVLIEMQAPDYKINWKEVQAQITSKTRMIIINTPHNPTGTVLHQEDMKNLERIVEGTDILILSDEVYEHINFDQHQHQSVALYPNLAERAFLVYSFGKTFHVTGWKTGYCFAPAELMKEFRKVHQFNVFCVNHPFQVALNSFLQEPQHYMGLGDFFQKKRDYFLNQIKDSEFSFTPAQGTYFQTLNYSKLTDEKDSDFAIRLIKDYGLASIPVSAFQKDYKDEKMLRFCFAKENELLKKAAEIINSL